jgi:hypothetical protein
MSLNYIKLEGAHRRDDFFLFRDEDVMSFRAALAAAREYQPRGLLAVWRPVSPMTTDLRCVGHAPKQHTVNEKGSTTSWICEMCKQVIPVVP